MWLLNHAEDVLHTPAYKRSNHYGPEVQHALFLVWNAANRICAKRLMPFLPTLLEALERHEHLHISEECAIPTAFHERSDSGSPAVLSAQTRDSMVSPPHVQELCSSNRFLSARSKAWNESQPGFLEAERARPSWHRHRGRLLVDPHPHRCSHRVDGRAAPLAPEPGNGTGSLPTSADAVPFSDFGD